MIRRSPPKAEAFTQQMWRYIFAALKFTGTCGRAVECTGFENRQTRKGLVSSNLTGSDFYAFMTNENMAHFTKFSWRPGWQLRVKQMYRATANALQSRGNRAIARHPSMIFFGQPIRLTKTSHKQSPYVSSTSQVAGFPQQP